MTDATNPPIPGAADAAPGTPPGPSAPGVDVDAPPATSAPAPEPGAPEPGASDPAGSADPAGTADQAGTAGPATTADRAATGEPAANGATTDGDLLANRAAAGSLPGADASDSPADAESPGAALAAAERARDEYLDHLRRERAEFENFRRRSTRERMDALDRGAERVVADLLGVLDNFGFALGAAAERDDSDPLAKGVQMVHDQLVAVLRGAGLQDVPGVGSVFDPNHHEAMLSVDSDTPVNEPVVVEILRPGYRFKGRVLRPASVKVAR